MSEHLTDAELSELRTRRFKRLDARDEVMGWKASDEITTLRARVKELEEALRFYAEGNWSDGYPGGVQIDDNTLDFGDVARAALAKTGDGQ